MFWLVIVYVHVLQWYGAKVHCADEAMNRLYDEDADEDDDDDDGCG